MLHLNVTLNRLKEVYIYFPCGKYIPNFQWQLFYYLSSIHGYLGFV